VKIWLITNLFAPDVHGGAALYTDMAEWFREQGHDVRVTTTFPYYPRWKLHPGDRGQVLREEIHDGIPLRRIRMYVPARASGLKRMLSDASFLWSLLRRGRFPGWTPDAIITAEPMLSQCTALRFLYPFNREIRRLIIVQDFVADAAIELGLVKNPVLAALVRGLERWSLRAAHTVTTISPSMLDKLNGILRGGRGFASRPHTACVPNWIHGGLERAARSQLGTPPLRQSKVLLYSGNLGAKQGLPEFIRLFAMTHSGWELRIHGEGAAAAEIAALLPKLNAPGIQLHGILDDAAYIDALFTCAACVITQKSGVGANFLPSKVLPCLATGTPVLAFAAIDSPLAREVTAGAFGLVANEEDTLRDSLGQLSTPQNVTAYGENARRWAQRYEQTAILSQHLLSILPVKNRPPAA
jgi:colanic acid biosynthesis glycosyl transferase WcaI